MKPLIVLSVVALSGCATTYDYAVEKGRFDILPLSESSYRVALYGNAFTQPGAVTDLVVLRAAELCIDKGYTHYAILADRHSEKFLQTTRGYSSTTGTASPDTGVVFASTSHTEPKGLTIHGAEVVVQCLGSDSGGLSAAETAAHIKAKHAK